MRQQPTVKNLWNTWRHGDEGAALLFVMLGVAVMTALGISLVGLGMVSTTMTTSERETTEALAIADAGMAHAQRLVMWGEWNNLNQILQNGNGTACDGDELAALPTAPLPTGFPTAAAAFIPAAGLAYGSGQYTIQVCDDHIAELNAPVDPAIGLPDANPNSDVNRQIIIRATGVGPNGATATVEMLLGPQDVPAVIINGNARLSGNPEVMGIGGIIHTNGEMRAEGNACTEQYFGSVGTIDVGGGSLSGGAGCLAGDLELRPDSEPVNLPDLNPIDFKLMADYWLENDGTAYDGTTGLAIPVPPGLNFLPGQKKWASVATVPGGTYWVNANFSLGSSPGPALPMTILAEGYVEVTGTPDTVPDLCPVWVGCISMIAGTDIDIAGGGTSFAGLYYATHQLEISGSPTFNGQIFALNEADTCDTTLFSSTCNLVQLDALGRMHLSGSPIVTFNGNGLVSTTVRKWRECRGPNLANRCGPLYASQPSLSITFRATQLLSTAKNGD